MGKTVFFFLNILLFSPFLAISQKSDRMQWWEEAKFGLFVHWGIYSVPGGYYQGKPVDGIGEWIMNFGKIPVAEYKHFAPQFNPQNYDPEFWVRLAKDAGMKYLIITTKHHDGFALFDSKVTDWDVVDATPYGKDLLKPLAKACHREGIKLGFYYSQAQDWVHPGGAASGEHWDPAQDGNMDEYLEKIAIPQVKEILSNYGDIAVLWWDTPKDMTKERAEKFLPVLEAYPDLVTNNRLGGGIQGDTETPEQFIPPTGFPGRHWEVCMTMNDTWGYKKDDNNWKSAKELVLKLSDIVSKGGNFLLNIGPTANGEIPQASIERLQTIGMWMKKNSIAINGTQASPFAYLPWGKTTRKGQTLYLHVSRWPVDGKLKLPMTNKLTKAFSLNDPSKELEITGIDGIAEIVVRESEPDSLLSIIAVDFEGEPDILPVPTKGRIPVSSSTDSLTNVINLFDGDLKNSWKPAPGENKAWIEVDLGEKISIGNLVVAEPWLPWDNHGQEFLLQCKKNGTWINVTNGKTTGCGYSQDFEPVTSQNFRLVISGAQGEVPVLNEWILNRAL
ncbi:MAG: alpha-L-fucosidase [Mangrovibacterium sp.]